MKGKGSTDRIAQGVIDRLDDMVLSTPTGKLRTLLMDASIVIDVYKSGGVERLIAKLTKENADTNPTSNEARARLVKKAVQGTGLCPSCKGTYHPAGRHGWHVAEYVNSRSEVIRCTCDCTPAQRRDARAKRR